MVRVDYEAVSNAQKATNPRIRVLFPSAGRGSARRNQEHGRGGICRKQADGRSPRGFDQALPRHTESVAGWEALHAGDEGSGFYGDARSSATTVWRGTWRSQGRDREAK